MSRDVNGKFLLRTLAWPLFVGFILISIALPLQWLFSLHLSGDFTALLSYRWLSLAMCMQALAALAMVLSWKVNLRLQGMRSASLRQCAVMIGLNSIGKYTPGKVLGIVARGTALYKLTGDGRLALQSTLVEQTALLHSGGALAVLAWLWSSSRHAYVAIALLLIATSIAFVSRSGEMILTLLARFSKRVEIPRHIDNTFRTSYGAVFLMMTLVWVLSAAALYFCVAAYDHSNTPAFWRLQWIIVIAYVTGFMAFFTLAGLGAREGIMLAMLSTHMDASVAAYIAILHRLLTLLIDVLLGIYALQRGREFLTAASTPSGTSD